MRLIQWASRSGVARYYKWARHAWAWAIWEPLDYQTHQCPALWPIGRDYLAACRRAKGHPGACRFKDEREQ